MEETSNKNRRQQRYYGIYMSILNGWLGSTASCCGKLALDSTISSYKTRMTRPNYFNFLATLLHSYRSFWHSLATMICHSDDEMSLNRQQNIISESGEWHLHVSRYMSCYIVVDEIIPRSIYFVCMLLLNAMMLSTFLISLRHCGSVSGTSICSASNMIFSALYGYLVFHDTIRSNLRWSIGFTFILVGVVTLATVQPVDDEQQVGGKVNRIDEGIKNKTKSIQSDTSEREDPRKID